MTMSCFGLGVDIGGSHISLGLIDREGVISCTTRLDMNSVGEGQRWAWICDQVLSYVATVTGGVGVVVVSYPGPVSVGMQLGSAPTVSRNIAGARAMMATLRDRLSVSVVPINDIACASFHIGSQRKSQRLLVVSVSSGIGAKVFVGNGVSGEVISESMIAGEIGHFPIAFDLRVECDCLEINHLQAVASGRGIERVARLVYGNRLNDVKGERSHAGQVTEECVFPAARRKEEWALDVLSKCVRPLVVSILPVIACLDVTEVVFIGGVVAHGGPVYEAVVRQGIDKCVANTEWRYHIQSLIAFERSTNESCLLGALGYAGRRLWDSQ